VLLIIAILGYGLLIPWLGFYWDDWPSIWFLHTLGPQGFREVFASDRPFLGQLFILSTSIMGERILSWHLFSLFARWLAAVFYWGMLRQLWPENQLQVAWAALLFMIYPGFTQQPIAVTYSHAWLILAVLIASLGANIWAIRRPKFYWPLIGLSLLCSAFAMFSTEYFFTLEMLRPVLIWMVLCESEPNRGKCIRKTLTNWLPFVLLMVIFLYWRIVIHEFPRGELYEAVRITENPFQAILQLFPRVLLDIAEAGVLGWVYNLKTIFQTDFKMIVTLSSLALAILTFIFILIYFSRYPSLSSIDKSFTPSSAGKWGRQAIILGLFSLFIAGWPFWLTDLVIKLDFPNDRFTMPFIIGSSLLVAGLIDLIPNSWPRLVILGTLTGLAVGQIIYNANNYRLDWNSQKEFFRQLTWRAPNIAPGTVIMTARLPLRYFSDNSLTAPLNWIYGTAGLASNLSYLFYDIQARRGNRPMDLNTEFSIDFGYRSMVFSGSSEQVLVVAFHPPGCLKLVDPAFDAENPILPKPVDQAYHLSDPRLVDTIANRQNLPDSIFGEEPLHDWCFYFEMADLSRQNGDWQQVAATADKALNLRKILYPVNASELVPYVEGYAYTGQWEKARAVSTQAIRTARNVKSMLCQAWERIEQGTPPSPDRDDALQAIKHELKCAGGEFR
jgi:hypothetical protein